VLIAGGTSNNFNALRTAQLYDPATHSFSPTGAMAAVRYFHTATLLPNGQVLVAGGRYCYFTTADFCSPRANAELFNPASGTWSTTGSMANARVFHTATMLPNGIVLIAGGCNQLDGAGDCRDALASA